MNYLLLTDKNNCPACRHNNCVTSLPSRCRHCGMWLFLAENNMKRFEEQTGWREYWVWTGNQEGWKHRSHIMSESKPLERELNLEKLPDNYGTPEFHKQRLADSRKELKAELKKRKKKPVTVRKTV